MAAEPARDEEVGEVFFVGTVLSGDVAEGAFESETGEDNAFGYDEGEGDRESGAEVARDSAVENK